MNFDSKPNQVAHKQNMEKLQPKNDFQSLNESVLTMSMYREELVSVLDIPYEESEVIQETVRTYAKQIPKSPIKRNLNINLGNSQEKSTKDFNFTDQNTVLKNIANNNNSSNNKNNNIMSNSTKKFCKEVGDEYDQVNISPRQIKKQGKVNKFIQLNENVEPKPGIHALQKQINSRVFDDRDDYMNTLQSISPRNDQILHTQSQERSFVSQISYYSYTQPYNQYDKENTHSGYISYSNIRPKKSLLNSFQRISQKWLVNTKQLYNETFNNRKRCKCDINLTEGETCSQAIAWLKQQYRNNDFSKMKEQYKSLLQMKDIYQQYKHQIDLDAVRTYPSSGLFHEGAPLCQSLKNILYAFSVYDIQVGYVQGINFIVGLMLYHAEEYIAFWLTCMMFESLEMRDIYLPQLPGIKKHTYLIEFLMWKHTPYIHQIFFDNDIKVEQICQSWIISLCGILIPLDQMTQFVDKLLKEGWSFFYRFVITYILFHEDDIVKQEDPEDVVALLTSQSYQLDFYVREEGIQWDQLMKSALNIKVNESIIRELHEKFDIELKDFRRE